ncbi:MAG: hypothetical protein M9962_13740 [Oligoflexia bacterium]|nr:hypothetical protein [Oligoflexia bacterium]
MDIYVRSIVTYGIFFLGSQVVYFGMKFNGSASPRNPIWHLVNGFHSFVTYGTLLVVVIFIFIEFVFPLVLILIDETSKYLQPPRELAPEEHQANKKQSLERLEEDRKEQERFLEEQQRIEAKKKEEEELRKQKIVEERKSRTAEEVTRSALDDFL